MAVLIIAGLDTGGGAGLKADIETVSALEEHPLPVLTSVTYQNPGKVSGYFSLPPEAVRREIRAVRGSFEIGAVKIGMLGSGEIAKVVAKETEGLTRVFDPVMASSTGERLIDDIESLKVLVEGSIVTPNVPEAEALSGLKIHSLEDMKESARFIAQTLKAEAVIVKGGHLNLTDLLYWRGEFFEFPGERVGGFTHGTGCAFSSALAAFLAKEFELPEAVKNAKSFVEGAIGFSKAEAKAVNPLWKLQRDTYRWRAREELEKAIEELVKLGERLNPHVPEVRTNFALATPFGEVFAVKGRIVRYGKTVKPVGPVELNASDHLKRALLKMREFYPEVRAVLNLRYSEGLIARAKKLGLAVSFYDMREEPEEVKRAKRGTMEWGIETAVRRAEKRPDVIYHLGDWGKEPMALIFGRDAQEVVERVSALVSSAPR
ncbi:bifunctional hydroxymethylpyrimidine kinase/phosphomethylpyrimidine kinase [Thermococcus aciditolerans]|uniref:Bifunctional hydroxymethylpyrimidine kinase/phosphomethylpyrimidine kinase n=1 Tax=Thermococcus aciditolerans TaxID=2598455 RepID=A0A5C0SLC1_9EURY|nr:bifunctional hydroxymethylpyrimidine kinase/phosphomethylpyrimidine kinase [Thermococcus aciditolerans]QEK14234.1 bifunctional hydroxymethylpyrimidine kinase/phosphomethylpyrimidine kinase [Thermococcus aciditolerans]